MASPRQTSVFLDQDEGSMPEGLIVFYLMMDEVENEGVNEDLNIKNTFFTR
jgi:hypothetical protein